VSRVRFAAIVDSGYLTRAVVLYESLRNVAGGVSLEIVCMDAEARRLLEILDLEGVGVLDIAELETYDPALVDAKCDRTIAEYCWTAKASLCQLLFDRYPATETVVYLDADLMFFADPALVLRELRGQSVLVVPHRSPPNQHWEDALGRYNAGFIAFRRGPDALAVLEWWRARCLEWCFERIEPGRYCDQKYLDEWPRRFSGVHALEHVGGGLAPWNTGLHALTGRRGKVYVDGDVPLVIFHYQSLKLYRGVVARLARLGLMPVRYRSVSGQRPLAWSVWTSYEVSSEEERLIYAPYARGMAAAADSVALLDPTDRTFTKLGVRRIASESARALVPARIRAALRRRRSPQGQGDPRPTTLQ
jgi:hypothetical protein